MTGVKESLSTWALGMALVYKKIIEYWSRQRKTCSSKLPLQYNILLHVSSHLDVLWTNDETTSFVFLQDSHLVGCFTSSASCSSLIGHIPCWKCSIACPRVLQEQAATKKVLAHDEISGDSMTPHHQSSKSFHLKFQGFCLACQALPKVQHKRAYRWLWHAIPWHKNGMLAFAWYTGTGYDLIHWVGDALVYPYHIIVLWTSDFLRLTHPVELLRTVPGFFVWDCRNQWRPFSMDLGIAHITIERKNP